MNGLGDRVIPSDGPEGLEIQSKDMEFALRPGSCNMLESQEMLIPSNSNFSRNTQFIDIMNGENVNRCVNSVDASDRPSASRLLMDDAGTMVQELTVRHYNGATLAIVGTSNNKDTKLTRQSQRQRVSQLVVASGSGSSNPNIAYRDSGQAMLTDQNETMEQLTNAENEAAANVLSHGGIRTKMLCKSVYSEFIVKQSLKGKGISFRGPLREVYHAEPRGQTNNTKAVEGTMVASSIPPSLCAKTDTPPLHSIAATVPCPSNKDGFTLREWLKVGNRKVNKPDSLHIFKQVVDLVDCSHAQGVPLHDIRPSCFKLLPSNIVHYLGSEREVLESVMDQGTSNPENCIKKKKVPTANLR